MTVAARPFPLRLAMGLGAADREQALLPPLTASGEIVVVVRCLSAEQLLETVRGGQVDIVLVGVDLHRFSSALLAEVSHRGVPLVVLAPSASDEPWTSLPGTVLPFDATAEMVTGALLRAVSGSESAAEARSMDHSVGAGHGQSPSGLLSVSMPQALTVCPPSSERSIIVVGGGAGSPGRTTVAVNLAVALGARVPTALVDADFDHPSVHVMLDVDITRNLALLAHSEPATAADWDRSLAQEMQPLDSSSPHAAVLCGIPKPELRRSVAARFFERLLAELQQRYRYVVVDIGADVLVADAALHRTALTLAQQVLLVTSADLLGLHSARTVIGAWEANVDLRSQSLALIINKYDRRYSYGRSEIEWSLRTPVAAVVPLDYGALQRALVAQRPLVLQRSSRAAAAILDLANRIQTGAITLDQSASARRPARWRRLVPWRRRGFAPAAAASAAKKGGDEHVNGLAVHEQSGYRQRPHSRAGAAAGSAGSRT